MMKIPAKASVCISMIFTVAFLALVVACAATLPWITPYLMHMPTETVGRAVVLVILYLILLVGGVAGVLMLRLLRLVQRESVFTEISVATLRGVSWCCVLAGVLFAVLGWYFPLAPAVGFVAVFVGLCLRVMKNVLEEATILKSENDLTV